MLPDARESCDYVQSLTYGDASLDGHVDLTGYTLKASFYHANVATVDFTLDMAPGGAGEGLTILDGPSRLIGIRILAATLSGIDDTTGDFILQADLLATPPAGERFLLGDLTLRVIKGPTT
ncbi:hypothetical protein [Sphingomonas oryzagri]|uniref:Lipid/polyisoprenoid-binding YceI-like domain-containing protein n=1 Tax=Sphingomonas oryzagri TaxID=3042314 RepID=A0ABT6N5Y6_9SPHN|nr:hypothetical protein [Sphingomonas oryzagri]MDH7640534.1 hypothetical protein [Sphingomonas oryzagri]